MTAAATASAPPASADAPDASDEDKPNSNRCGVLKVNGPLDEFVQFLSPYTDESDGVMCEVGSGPDDIRVSAQVTSEEPQALLEQASVISMAGLEIMVTADGPDVLTFRASVSTTAVPPEAPGDRGVGRLRRLDTATRSLRRDAWG